MPNKQEEGNKLCQEGITFLRNRWQIHTCTFTAYTWPGEDMTWRASQQCCFLFLFLPPFSKSLAKAPTTDSIRRNFFADIDCGEVKKWVKKHAEKDRLIISQPERSSRLTHFLTPHSHSSRAVFALFRESVCGLYGFRVEISFSSWRRVLDCSTCVCRLICSKQSFPHQAEIDAAPDRSHIRPPQIEEEEEFFMYWRSNGDRGFLSRIKRMFAGFVAFSNLRPVRAKAKAGPMQRKDWKK